MNLSQKGLDLIKRFEGIRLIAYKVVPTEKHFTIGYGHYGADVKQAMRITEEQAEELLKQDVASFVNGVNACLKVKVNQNQFDALVSFAYNVGLGALIKSDLLQYLNQGDYKKASQEFPKWNKSGGQVLQGLANRRKVEQTLFNHVTDLPYKVIIPNTAFWQAKALVIEFEERGFECEGVALKIYHKNEQPKEKDPYHFVVYCEHERAKDLVIELKHRGYDRVYGEEIK